MTLFEGCLHPIARKNEITTNQENKTVKQQKPARKKTYPWLGITIAAVAILSGFYLLSGNTSKAEKGPIPTLPPAELTGAAPAFTLQDMKGKPVSLADFRGKVVVLDFWATWCPPCKKEIPDFVELQRQYGSKGVQFVGIALDEPNKVTEFVQQNGINYPILMGNDAITAKYGGIDGIPTTFVIDKNGKIVNRFEGFRPRNVFETQIKKLL